MKRHLFPFVFLLGGIILIALALIFHERTERFVLKSETASGKVVEMISNPRGGWSKAPKVEFVTKEGLKVVFRSNVYSNPPGYEVGESVDVLYDSKEPKGSAKIKSFFSLWGVQLILCSIGGGFICLSAIFFSFTRVLA